MIRRIYKYTTVRPLQSALLLSTVYILLCGLYIWVSGHLAASSASSVQTLEYIERLKGTIFILATGILFFLFSYLVLKRIARQSDELMEKKNALVTSDRRAMAGVFALSIAHDMNNQIMVIKAGMEELSDTTNPKQKENLHFMQTAVADMVSLSRQLLSMGRDTMVEDLQPCNLMELFKSVIDMASLHHRTRSCDISPSIHAGLNARLNPFIISQMLFNLILNAADAMDGRGRIEVRAHTRGSELIIEVHDQGPGIPEAMRAEVMKPFFTTKKSGHGLGFMSVMACAEIHDGKMEISDSDLRGACVRISMPHRQ